LISENPQNYTKEEQAWAKDPKTLAIANEMLDVSPVVSKN